MRDCMSWNSGPIFVISTTMPAPSSTTAARMIQESPASSRSAMTTPPTIVMGAPTSITQVISTSICTCCTSFVERVIRLGAPNLFISRAEKLSVRSKMASRTSRPNCMAVFAPAQTAPICAAPWTRDSSSITPPVPQMKSTSPVTTPSSMMRAFSVGRYSDMMVAIVWSTTTMASSPQ